MGLGIVVVSKEDEKDVASQLSLIGTIKKTQPGKTSDVKEYIMDCSFFRPLSDDEDIPYYSITMDRGEKGAKVGSIEEIK